MIEVKTQLTHRDYLNMLAQRDDSHFTIFKRISSSSFEMYNLEENKMYLANIGLHLKCNAEKVITCQIT